MGGERGGSRGGRMGTQPLPKRYASYAGYAKPPKRPNRPFMEREGSSVAVGTPKPLKINPAILRENSSTHPYRAIQKIEKTYWQRVGINIILRIASWLRLPIAYDDEVKNRGTYGQGPR